MNGSGTGTVRATDMVTLYAGQPVKLWVEDAATRAYLQECWQDPQIGFLVAGSRDGVVRVVDVARSDGFGHVFGMIDRDFGKSNRPTWNDANGPTIFRLEAHEIENLVLDPAHLAGCDLNMQRRTESEIRTRLENAGRRMLWRQALREVLTELRRVAIDDFPGHPDVKSKAEASMHITTSPWFGRVTTEIPKWTSHDVDALLDAAYAQADDVLTSGRFLDEFSGKELFRDLRDWLYRPAHGTPSATERDIDLVRSAARFQVTNRSVPAEVADLRAALRLRCRLPP